MAQRTSTALLLVLLTPPSATFAETLVVSRISGEIEIDGRIDEDVWRRVEPLQLTQLRPSAGGRPSERSEIRIAYDDNYLYAAGAFFDEDADGVRGNSLQRDASQGDDLFGLVLDSFNDNESAVAFYTNPVGTRIDETISNDGEWGGGRPFNRSWNTFWDSAARRTDEGWFAEIRIPFSSLRFQSRDGEAVMGLIAWRYIARKTETATYPAIDAKWNRGHMKPSLAEDVVFRDLAVQKPLHVTSYVLAGSSDTTDVNDDETAFSQASESITEVGVDVKYGLTSNLNLDLTVNTDFAQVEADDAVVNLSRFSIFQPEKRQFFLERSGLFDFATGGPSRLFYSRRIGLGEDGEAVPILAGVRLGGRLGKWDVGLLDMQTDALDDQSGENFGVLRTRRQVLNEQSYVGGILTSRIGEDGSSNLAYGLDAALQLTEDDDLTLRWAQTFDRDAETDTTTQGLDSGRFYGALERRTQEGWGYSLITGWSGEDFLPELGFAARTDFLRLQPELRRGWVGKEGDRLQRRSLWLGGDNYWRAGDGSLESADFGFGGNVQTRKGSWMWVDLRAFRENLVESFELGDGVEVVAGEHDFAVVAGGFSLPEGRDIRTWANFRAGTFYDGTRWGFGIGPTWTVSRRLSLSGEYQFNAIRFDDRDQSLDIHLGRLRARYALNNRFSVDLFSQYSSQAGQLGSNLRLRYNFREGTDLFLVYNETLNTERQLDTLLLPQSDNRTLLLKYTYTLSL